MSKNLIKAREVLEKEQATCVFCHNDDVVISHKRGVKPLIECIDSGKNYGTYSVADKVIGNGAAYLYVILGVREIYAGVISEPACATLDAYGITFTYDKRVESIQNRTGTGICPMEQAVSKASSPQEAFELLKKKLQSLSDNINADTEDGGGRK